MRNEYLPAFAARLFSTVSAVGCGLLSLKVYSVFLPVEIYGVVVIGLTILSYLPMLDGGFRTTANRTLLSEKDAERRRSLIEFAQVFYSYFALGAVLVACLLMAGYSLTDNPRETGVSTLFFVTLGLAGAALVFGTAQMSLLVGLNRQAAAFTLTGVQAWATLGVLTVSLLAGWGVWSFPISTVAGILLVYLIAIRQVRRVAPEFLPISFKTDSTFWREFERLKSGAIACFRSQVSIVLLFTMDVVLVGLVSSPEMAAIYAVLSRLLGIVRSVLQAGSEAAWPVIARSGGTMKDFTAPLLRVNAWGYGAVAGGLLLTLPKFLETYMGPDWAPPAILVWLLGARFLVTGVSSPVAFFFYGTGDFKLVARHIERELGAALAAGVVLAFWWMEVGVAAGFLAATMVSTCWKLLGCYSEKIHMPRALFFSKLWLRALAAFGVGLGITLGLSHYLSGAASAIGIGVLAAAGALAVAISFAVVRAGGRELSARRLFQSF